MADPAFIEVQDPTTGAWYLVDPLTGQPATLTDQTTGQPVQAPPYYDPSSRQPGVQQSIAAQYPGGATFIPPDVGRQAIDASGQVRPDLTPLLPAPAAEQATTSGPSPSTGGGSGGGYGGYSSSYGSRHSSYDANQGPDVRYANGQTPPYFGGPPLVPGGQFNDQSGYDNRTQVTSTSGATAGPFGVHAAPAPSSRSYGGSSSSGGGGGGGGITKDLYWHFANQIKDKLMGGGSSSSSYSSSYPSSHIHPYKGPTDPHVVKKVQRITEQRASEGSTYSHPEFAIPGGVNLESPMGDRLQGLPGDQLALLMGAGTKGWQGGIDPTQKITDRYYKKNSRLINNGKQGMDYLPYYKKALRKDHSLDQYNHMLTNIYNGFAQGQRADTGQLFGNLVDPKKGTYIAKQFHRAAPGDAADQFMNSYNAILAAGDYGDLQRRALSQIANDAVTRYGQTYTGHNPRHMPSLNAWVGSQLSPYMRSY